MQTKSKYSFFVWIIKDWNNLPNHLYVNKFKIGYKKRWINTYWHNSSYFNCICIVSSQSASSKRPRTAKIGRDLRLSTSIISLTQRLSTLSCMNFFYLGFTMHGDIFSCSNFCFSFFPIPTITFLIVRSRCSFWSSRFPLPASRYRKTLGPGNEGIRKMNCSQPRFHCIPWKKL